MNVLWLVVVAVMIGMEVLYLTFLLHKSQVSIRSAILETHSTYVAPSGNITLNSTFSYDIPSLIFGPSRNGTLST